jgi:hypothetical protein
MGDVVRQASLQRLSTQRVSMQRCVVRRARVECRFRISFVFESG